jgi:hypothetical protein
MSALLSSDMEIKDSVRPRQRDQKDGGSGSKTKERCAQKWMLVQSSIILIDMIQDSRDLIFLHFDLV